MSLSTISENELHIYFIKALCTPPGTNDKYGDCILITGEQNGIIDLGYDPELQTLFSFIVNYIDADPVTGKRKIDYIILTHYHEGHVTSNISGALSLLTEASQPSLDLSDCTVYLPHRCINWTSVNNSDVPELRQRESDCNDVLFEEDEGLIDQGKIGAAIQPCEGHIRFIGTDAKITFYNVDPAHYSSYYNYHGSYQNDKAAQTDYNAFSMMTILEHCGHKFVFTGDMSKPAQAYYHDLVRDCDVYKIEHHGLEYDTNDLWLNELNPKYAVVCQHGKKFRNLPEPYNNASIDIDDEATYRKTIQHLAAKGTKIFSTHDSNVSIVSTENDLKVECGEIYQYPYGDVGFNTTLPYFIASRNLLTVNDSFDIVGGGFTRYGNMVIVQMMVRAMTTKGANSYWPIAKGFPLPFNAGVLQRYPQAETGETEDVPHYLHAPMQIIRYGNKTEHYTGWIAPSDYTGGVLRVGVGATNIPQDSTLYISGVYFTSDE